MSTLVAAPLPAHIFEPADPLGKRREPSASVHQASKRQRASTSSVVLVNGKLTDAKAVKKVFRCQWAGCDKSYAKACRLEEHERTHTGERPFVCVNCSAAFFRDSHLRAHERTHLSADDKPIACTEPGCARRFWTNQHLHNHIKTIHKSESETYQCTECDESFNKNYQLRTHFAQAHCPPDTLPFICGVDGCDKSFKTGAMLRRHQKIHDPTRYVCAHEDCLALETGAPRFAHWTALQSHMKMHQRARCPHSHCHRSFAGQAGLHSHLAEEHSEDEAAKAIKKRVCPSDDCHLEFDTIRELRAHRVAIHGVAPPAERHHCSQPGCHYIGRKRTLLSRHLASVHRLTLAGQTIVDRPRPDAGDIMMGIAELDMTKRYMCPYGQLIEGQEALDDLEAGDCGASFDRAFDVERHLMAAHGLCVDRHELEAWMDAQ